MWNSHFLTALERSGLTVIMLISVHYNEAAMVTLEVTFKMCNFKSSFLRKKDQHSCNTHNNLMRLERNIQAKKKKKDIQTAQISQLHCPSENDMVTHDFPNR